MELLIVLAMQAGAFLVIHLTGRNRLDRLVSGPRRPVRDAWHGEGKA